MTEVYRNFDLYLIWDEATKGISIECDCPAIGDLPALTHRSPSKPLAITTPQGTTMFSTLRNKGQKIADVLLPECQIRWLFRKWWNAGVKIRLRLIYPHPDYDNHSEQDRSDQIREISSRPWEYAYLTKDGSDLSHPKYLLGIREEISIVHCLRNPKVSKDRSLEVAVLPIAIRYISHLGLGADNEQNEKNIFNEFRQQISILNELSEQKSFNDEPASADVEMGFLDDHLVHITSHGNLEMLKIEPDDPFTKFEAMKTFNHALDPKVKVVILLSCGSRVGSAGMATWLHYQAKVPIVIGMSGAILPDPSAINFVKGFYYGLNRPQEGIEKAVFLARLTMYNQGPIREGETLLDSQWDPSFGLPRLYLNASDSTLIPDHLLFGSLETMVKDFKTQINEGGQLASEITSAAESSNLNEYLPTVINWINEEKNAWYLITAPESRNKTRLIERLLYHLTVKKEKAPEEAKILENFNLIYHFCQKENSLTSDPLDFIRYSLAPQLIDHYGEDYKKAIRPGKFPLLERNEKYAIQEFVVRPLQELQKNGEFVPPLIIIDSLDVIDRNYTILQLLYDNQGDLEDVARFIVTADSVDREQIEDFVRSTANSNEEESKIRERIENEILKAENIMEDIYRLTDYPDAKSHLAIEKAEKSPKLLFVEMQRQLAPVFAVQYYSPPPVIEKWAELYELFDDALYALEIKSEEPDWMEHVHRLFEVVTVAYEPLHIDSVAAIVGPRVDGVALEQLTSELQPFFRDYDLYDHRFILYHPSLKSYFLHKADWWHNRNLNDAHKHFVEAFRPPSGEWTDVTDWTTLSGTQWPAVTKDKPNYLDSIARYARRYLVNHAYYSCYYTSWNELTDRRKRAKVFLALICDPGFRTARLREVGQRAALQDIWLGLRIINAEYIHGTEKYHTTARVAFDRLLAAHQPNSYQRNKLIELEEKLRTEADTGWQDLFVFLGFDQDYELTWW